MKLRLNIKVNDERDMILLDRPRFPVFRDFRGDVCLDWNEFNKIRG